MEAWTLRSQEIQSLEVFEMCCLQAIRRVTSADRLQNIKIREDTLNLSQMSPDTEDWWFGHVCCLQRDNIIRQVYKQDFKGQQKRGTPLSDQIRNDSGLPQLTAEQHVINRTECICI